MEMGYPTPPLSVGRNSPKISGPGPSQSSLPPYTSQLTQQHSQLTLYHQNHNLPSSQAARTSHFPPYDPEFRRQPVQVHTIDNQPDASDDRAHGYHAGRGEREQYYAMSMADMERDREWKRTTEGEKVYTKRFDPESEPVERYPQPSTRSGRRSNAPRTKSASPVSFLHQRPISPYSASRPRPRRGFVRRILHKVRQLISNILSYARKHPIQMAFMSCFPLLALGGIARGLWKKATEFGGIIRDTWRADRDGEGDPEDVCYHFRRFAGTKAGAVDGFLKLLQMLINHWCRLTPSNYPRLVSLGLELYFLEPWKPVS